MQVLLTEKGLSYTLIPCINVGSRTYIASGERREEILARLNLSETASVAADGSVIEK